ncbi:MAG: hypothetical protein J7M34_06715 [Anaerolineae bacterium]|nr:hypothetical protein [Anaerolineae bacterium]
MDISLLTTVAVIFVAAMVGAYLQSTKRDRCLKSFDGFHITIERKNGRVIWGVMHLEPTGMELEYRSDVHDKKHIETSYVFYRSEYGDIQTIFRYVDQLTAENIERRNRDLERSFHPNILRRLGRKTRNFINTANDSLSEALNVVMGRVKAPGQLITDVGQKQLTQVGKSIIGYVGTSYDPLLERYVGSKVVVEVVEGDTVYEYVGVLKEYSADFLEVLDVYYPESHAVSITSDEMEKIERDLTVRLEGARLLVKNQSEYPLLLERVVCGDEEKMLNIVLDLGNEAELHLARPGCEAQVVFKIVRHVDMIVPRAHALVRHRAERYDPDRFFDIGVALHLTNELEQREQELRRRLDEDPTDAISANALAGLLIKRGELKEARHWLEVALAYRHDLPDHGKRARQQLERVKARLRGYKKVV